MDTKKYIMGIDPGANGAVAVMNQDNTEDSFVFEFKKMTLHDIAEEIANIRSDIRACVIEAVGVMPGQGIASGFKFGVNYGQYLGILTALKIPYLTARPAKWQAALNCLSKGNKNVTKEKAQKVFAAATHIKITHAVADALLISYYGATLVKKGELI